MNLTDIAFAKQMLGSGGGGGSATPLIVTLTPTSPDYSGDMDKTPEEITTAVAQGRDIVFSIPTMSVSAKATYNLTSGQYTVVATNIIYIIDGIGMVLQIVTSDSTSTYNVNSFDFPG